MKTLIPTALAVAAALAAPSASATGSEASCTGFIDAVPAVVNSQGTWCLRQDLATAITTGSAIEITTNNATLDCNGFKLGGLAAGPTSVAVGVLATDRNNLTVRNCAVRGFHSGILLNGGGSGHLVEDNRLDGNLRFGIRAIGSAHLVRRNRVFDTGGDVDAVTTIAITASGDVVDNIVEGVAAAHANGAAYGISASGSGHEVRGNIVAGVVPQGAGAERGISASGTSMVLVDNQLTAREGSAGSGLLVNAGLPGAFCGGNTLSGFATAIDGDCLEIAPNPSN